MASLVSFGAAILLVVFTESIYAQNVFGSLDIDNVRSTMSITRKACIFPGITSEVVAKRFIDCYDEAPGKEVFFTCQKDVYGRLFDTVSNIRMNCANPTTLPLYAGCIQREMDKAGLNINDAVRKLNACQTTVFSYEQYDRI